MTIMIVDAQNAFHRARAGFKMGPAPIVFNFFRQFKSLVEKFKPEKIIFALEGKPVHRKELDSGYKANRVISPEDPRYNDMLVFFSQVDTILDLLGKFPVTKIRHPTSEADDTIANIVKQDESKDYLIISSDSDFIQLLDDYANVQIYNPVKDIFCQKTDYNYALWKSLCGDPTDCIEGLPGIGAKRAEKLASSPELLAEYFEKHPDHIDLFEKSASLVKFKYWTPEESEQAVIYPNEKNWESVKQVFSDYKFSSIVSENKWEKFVNSFDYLWLCI